MIPPDTSETKNLPESPSHRRHQHLRPRSAPVRLVRRALGFLQQSLYAWFFSVEIMGAENIPGRGGLIIAANHTSHLDMGMIKFALGPAGDGLISLAALDYFFEKPLYRWYFGNFTNLMPLNRRAGLKESLRAAGRVLNDQRNILIFPEGTRTRDGRMNAFKPAIGHLALNCEADVLPVYLEGAFQAMPKGCLWPRSRRLSVVFGPVIPVSELRRLTSEPRNGEASRAATALIEEAVRRLADRKREPRA